MDHNANLKKLIAGSSYNSIAEICKPLFDNFGFNTFIYSRIYSDGKYWTLSNRPDWLTYFYETNFKEADTFSETIENGYYFDLSELKVPSIQINTARESFDADNWLNVLKKFKGYSEICAFAAPKYHHSVTNLYLNHREIFDHFLLYFRSKADALIKNAEKNLIYPNTVSLLKKEHVISTQDDFENAKKIFYDGTKINKYFTKDPSNTTYLTFREFQSLKILANGYSPKEIGAMIGLTSRTVNYYLNNIKKKFGCYKKSQLIQILKDSNLDTLDIQV